VVGSAGGGSAGFAAPWGRPGVYRNFLKTKKFVPGPAADQAVGPGFLLDGGLATSKGRLDRRGPAEWIECDGGTFGISGYPVWRGSAALRKASDAWAVALLLRKIACVVFYFLMEGAA
jgi:hypothetical protein